MAAAAIHSCATRRVHVGHRLRVAVVFSVCLLLLSFVQVQQMKQQSTGAIKAPEKEQRPLLSEEEGKGNQ